MGKVKPAPSDSQPSDTPRDAAVRAAQAAAEAAEVAAQAALAAAEAAVTIESKSTEGDTKGEAREESAEWPPAPNLAGLRFWFARDFPNLPDGLHTCESLRRRGVDPDHPKARGWLVGFETGEPVLRRAQETGERTTVIHWW